MVIAHPGTAATLMIASPSGCGLNSRERRLVLPRGLTDRGADPELEDLVFAESGRSDDRGPSENDTSTKKSRRSPE
jgi:hypothetical protein